MKAMILAAGRGERLRPLTDSTPKPLISVGGRCLIEHNLLRMKAGGIDEFVINLSYRANQIADYLGDGSRYGVTIEYSFEGAVCLGTGGGVKRALPLLGEHPFWVVSADIWSDFNFSAKLLSGGKLHAVMVPNPPFHSQGDYAICHDGRLALGEPKLSYSGIALMQSDLFAGCHRQTFSLAAVINQAITAGCATGSLYTGPWFNVGTSVELNKLKQFMATHETV